jgi:hypothetical protein
MAKRTRVVTRPPARRNRPMSAKAMRAWRIDMGLSERDASQRLGMSRGGLQIAERKGAPLYIALACAALIMDIPPYLGE